MNMGLHLITGHSGFEHVTAADHGAFNAALLLSGSYVLNTGKKFSAQVVTNNSIKISDGELVMQGRHVRLKPGETETVTIANGQQEYKRNDLIVARYTKDKTSGAETVSFVVIQGTANISKASDPAYIEGNILNGVLTADFPLYRVPLDGLNVGTLVPLFAVKDNFDERINAVAADLEKVVKGSTKVGKASSADSAGKATSDGDGNNIADTYATNQHVQEILAGIEEGETPMGNAAALGGETALQWQGKITQINGTQMLSTSVIEKALEVDAGIYEYRLFEYSASDLPNSMYRYSDVTILKRSDVSIAIVLWGTVDATTLYPMQIKYYDDTRGWTGWNRYTTTADLTTALAGYLKNTGGEIAGNLTVYGTGAVIRQISLQNSLRRVYQTVLDSGEYYLFDGTNSKQIIKSSADGTTNTFNGTATGNLPLNGGGRVKKDGASPLELESASATSVWESFYSTLGYLGRLGFSAKETPAFMTTGGGVKELLHTDNSAKVAIQSTAPTDGLWVW